jgi:L-fuconolactonase
MPIVDSHCHASASWYEPVESLLFQMERYAVAHAILIQVFGQYDNTYQMDCLRRYPGRFASVVLIDTDLPNAPHTLERLAAEGASGVRFRPTTCSPGDDPLLIWRTAERLGLSVSCGGTGGDAALFASEEFVRVIAAVPRLKIVLEHLGTTGQVTGDEQHAMCERIFALARYPNVYMKVPGLGEIARRALPVREPFPFITPVPSLLDAAYAAFGPHRLMWGSDYPPVSHREGYGNALHWPMDHFAPRSGADGAMIFGGTALSVFPIRE